MDNKDFLTLLEQLTDEEKNKIAEESNAYKLLKSKYEFISYRINKLVEIILSTLDNDTSERVIQQLGCECIKTAPFLNKYIGNLDGYFNELEKMWGEKANYDEATRTITVITPERDCVCPIVKKGFTSPTFCNCSLGWQKTAYETILGQKVNVELVESVLRGSTKCVFKIHII